MTFCQFFRWPCPVSAVRPSKSNHSIWKILFVLGADEYIERLEGKIRKCLPYFRKWKMWKFAYSFHIYGNFLLQKLNSYRGKHWRGETMQERKLFAEIQYSFMLKYFKITVCIMIKEDHAILIVCSQCVSR